MKKKGEIIRCIFQIIFMLLIIPVFFGCDTKQVEDPLTPQEREWLKAHDGNITMALETSYAPFSFVDEKGKGRGLATEYIELIEKKLNFKIKKIQFNALNDILGSAQKKEIDIVNAVTQTQDRSRYLLFTKPFINIPNVIIVRKDQKDSLTIDKMKDMKISLVEHYAITEHLTKNYSELNVVLMPDDLSALMSVSFNQADATIIDLATASYFIEQKGITNLRIAGESGYNIKLAIASRNDWSILNRIMEKGLSLISDTEKKAIKDQWISFGQIRFSETREFWIIIATAFSAFLLVVLGILTWNRLLARQVEQRTIQLKKELAIRNQSEEKLKELKMQLSNALDMAHLGHWEYDVVNDLFIFNDHFYRIFGTTAEQEGGYSMPSAQYALRFVHPDDMHLVKEETLKAIETDSPDFNRQLEHRILYADGRVGYISVRFLIDKDSQGSTIRVYGVNQDITVRKQAQEALQESESRFRSIYNHTAVGLAQVSLDFKIISANKAYHNMLGYEENHLIGRHLKEITHPDVIDENIQKQTNLASGKIDYYRMEKKFIHKNGQIVHAILDANLIRDSLGTPIYLLGSVVDITEQKLAHAERENLQTQLIQAQKMESIGTLAGGIAHDFNNILFPIIGHTEMLMDDVPGDSPVQAGLKEIYASAIRAKDLVKQILAFARQEKNELKMMKMQPIIKEALKLIRSTIPTTISISRDIAPDCGAVKADPTQIHQIIMNLATNAWHAMAETGGELSVSLKQVELDEYNRVNLNMSPGQYACLTIEDTGTGIDQEVIHHIFDPFFTTKEKSRGTGMGLSVVHGIVKSMNGAIQVHSQPGKGSIFHIYLPVIETCSQTQKIETGKPIPGGMERILLVDDEAAIIALEKTALSRLGYQVTPCTSSTQALDIFRSDPNQFDLVITDMAMPNMSGDRLAGELTKIRPDIPILLCTGFSDRITDAKIKLLGIRGILYKPLVIKDFAEKIREILEYTESCSTQM